MICLPCTVRAAYDIASKATEDESLRRKVVAETIKWLAEQPDPLEISNIASLHTHVFRHMQRITGNMDPFKHLKVASNEIALKVLPVLEREVRGKKTLADAFRLAALGTICGNAIDFEVEGYKFSLEDLECSLLGCLKGTFAIDETSQLRNTLSKARKVLYLLDNAGEVVFDKFFIRLITENYPVKVWAVAKGGPVLNDATMEDAAQIGLADAAEVVTTGSDHIGLKIDEASEEFKHHLRTADLIIAKGQGNYESINEAMHLYAGPVVHILRAKCSAVAESLGVPQHGNVVKVVT